MLHSRFAIRLARETDIGTLVTFANALSVEEGDLFARFTRTSCRRAAFGMWPSLTFLLAERGGQPLGYAAYFVGYDTGENYRVAFMADLFVLPKHRRQGIAIRLLRAIADHARLRGKDRLCWGALPRRRAARRFYAAIGRSLMVIFRCRSRRRTCDGAPEV
jgi:GNAT superfamily N-acetyltransferase